MHYVGHRASETAPLRSIPLFQPAQHIMGVSPVVKAEALLRIARSTLAGRQQCYQAACATLGKANRMPRNWRGGAAGCRAFHQGEAMRRINAERKELRIAQRAVIAAEAALLMRAETAFGRCWEV